MQEIQFLEFMGGSNVLQAFPNYLICLRFIRISTVNTNSVVLSIGATARVRYREIVRLWEGPLWEVPLYSPPIKVNTKQNKAAMVKAH